MILLSVMDFTLPLTDPVLKFLLILLIILITPIILNRLRIPQLLGLIIAGAIIGPNGLNLVLRDSSIILSGTAGLLYIMFLAGLEIEMSDFKRNSSRSLVFGMYTFLIPMTLGILSGLYILKFDWLTSVLLASMFASHTLIAYPIISKLGITKNDAVSITVGGTMITDTLALLVLTVIVGMATGQVNGFFWIKLAASVLLFAIIVVIGFPFVGRVFFKRVNDNIAQYIFVLAMVFLAAFLAQLAGIEPIIGSFLAGLALNRLIPRSSPLMNRVEFVGNAIFIPFFLLGVGMLIDYKVFFTSIETVKVGIVMIVIATLAKFMAAWLTQKTYKLSNDQRDVVFGLSNAQAAATLAAVTVGYNVILGMTPEGEPIRLLNENVLNGTILMILVTCTIASFAAQRGAHNIALKDISARKSEKDNLMEHFLIPVSNEETVDELVHLSLALKSPANKHGLYALKVMDNQNADEKELKASHRVLSMAVDTAAATDTYVNQLLRYDLNVSNAIRSVVMEQEITDMVLGLHQHKTLSANFLGYLLEDILKLNDVNSFIYKAVQPLSTIRRHIIIFSNDAEQEIGFLQIMHRFHNVIRNTGAKVAVYAPQETLVCVQHYFQKESLDVDYNFYTGWIDLTDVARHIRPDDSIWVVLNRKKGFSNKQLMNKIPKYLNHYSKTNSFVLVYSI